MGGLRTLLRFPSALVILLHGLPATADRLPAAFILPALPTDPVQIFASCTGRLSALREHQWLIADGESAQTDALRKSMLDLSEAVTPADRAAEAMSWRVQAKAEMARTLSEARFGTDPARSAVARSRSDRMSAECAALVLAPDGA